MAHHRHEVGQLGHEVDIQRAQAVGRNEEQGHIDAGVSELMQRVGALGVLLALDVLAVLALNVLQDWLPCLLQSVVACISVYT